MATYAPRLSKKDGHINWKQPAVRIEAFIRGMTPWPGAYAFVNERRIKIFSAEPIPMSIIEAPGTVLKGFPDELRIATGDGVLSIKELQGESGKRLEIAHFLRGFPIKPGTVFR
jgi:methionyl-tRNA formyltransferase